MLKIEKPEVVGWEAAIRGMRNPLNSWDRSDSGVKCPYKKDNCCGECQQNFCIGPNDKKLMSTLRNAGTDHRKFMRMITVYLDITAPLYWWKEFKTYRAGKKFGDDEPNIIDDGYLEYDIEMNSCSTMHKIAGKEFTLDDFSHEHLDTFRELTMYAPLEYHFSSLDLLNLQVDVLNQWRTRYLNALKTETETGLPAKDIWWQMIQLLPSSYNQRRTIMLNYEVLANMYKSRRNHKLDEWHTFCDWIESLPYSELITGKGNSAPENSYCSGRR
jgi:hypothetical protein